MKSTILQKQNKKISLLPQRQKQRDQYFIQSGEQFKQIFYETHSSANATKMAQPAQKRHPSAKMKN